MNDQQATINDLKKLVANLIKMRDWQRFHTPKNLSIVITIEAAELMEHFQWMGNETSKKEYLAYPCPTSTSSS